MSRLLSYDEGNKEAFSGFLGSVRGALSPIEYGAALGPLKPAFEVLMNYDLFRDKYIIPPYYIFQNEKQNMYSALHLKFFIG